MAVHYYLTVFPMEALIASELSPVQFGSYMATGSKRGNSEISMFIEVDGKFGSDFDWQYAEQQCVPHSNGDPKHSVYLSVYRTLEKIPPAKMKSLYLTTRDGRAYEINPTDYTPEKTEKDYYIYQELCPITPLIVSKLPPDAFAGNITDPEQKVSVPAIFFADIRQPKLDDPEHTGNTGGLFFRQKAHFLNCVSSISSGSKKMNKTFNRTHAESFSYQLVGRGFYTGNGKDLVFFPMPTIEEIKEKNYDWGRSALII
ncbi:MAG: hypothetical protein JXB03_13500 [Spirochaetales bacterium]|nr:hypothetical protein [Spirochaetales bacterium]